MKRTVPVFIVVFLYTAIFVKICFNLSDIINNQRVFRQRNFLKALNKLTQELPFDSIHNNYDFVQFSNVLKAMKKPPYVLIFDSSNIDILLNHICNLQFIPNALSRIVTISYDKGAHDQLKALYPEIPGVVVDLEKAKNSLPPDIENRNYLIYTLALLTHSRICASLTLRNIDFWSMHQDTLWIENFESMNIEERYPNANLIFDTIGNDYLPEYTRMQDWICGSTFFVRAGPVTQQFFQQVESFMLSYQSPDSSVFSYLCGHYQYKCEFLPKWIISSFDYFKGPRDHPPVLIQMDASKKDGETKMDLFRKYNFVFRRDNGSCDPEAFHKLRSSVKFGLLDNQSDNQLSENWLQKISYAYRIFFNSDPYNRKDYLKIHHSLI